MVCAFIMSFASIEVIQFSLVDIISGLNGQLPALEVGITLYVILIVGTLLKLILFIYCRYVNILLKSDMLDALAEDHFNDVISNSAAIVTAAIAYNTTVKLPSLPLSLLFFLLQFLLLSLPQSLFCFYPNLYFIPTIISNLL